MNEEKTDQAKMTSYKERTQGSPHELASPLLLPPLVPIKKTSSVKTNLQDQKQERGARFQ